MVKFGLDLTIWPWQCKNFDELIGIACLAEKFGLDSLWFSDHLMYTTPNEGSLEVFTTLAAVAAKTQNIIVGTKVACVPFRHPGIIAKIGTTLDIISGGRFILGVGAGWYRTEFEAFGFPFENRVGQLRESVEILKMLWTQPVVDYEGKFYRVSKATCLPKPLQKPHPPVWIGSSGPRMLRLTAELGDGWVIPNQSPEDYRHKWDMIKTYAKRVGRRSDEIEAAYYAYSSIASSSEIAWKHAEEHILPERRRVLGPTLSLKDLEEICIIGSPDEWMDMIDKYITAGAEHLIMKIVPLDQDNLKLYAEKVIPYFKEES